jgi:hypothetical protein
MEAESFLYRLPATDCACPLPERKNLPIAPKLPGSKGKLLLSGAAAGLGYALLLRGSARFLHEPFMSVMTVMTVALLFLLPFAMTHGCTCG